MHLLLWNPPFSYGSCYKGPTRYVKRRAEGDHMFKQKTQNHELGLLWRNWHDRLSVHWPANEPLCNRNNGREHGRNELCDQTGPRDCAAFVFPDIFILFIYILCHWVIFCPGLVGMIWIYWSQELSGWYEHSIRAVAESCFQGQCTDVWGYPAAEVERVHPSFLLSFNPSYLLFCPYSLAWNGTNALEWLHRSRCVSLYFIAEMQ